MICGRDMVRYGIICIILLLSLSVVTAAQIDCQTSDGSKTFSLSSASSSSAHLVVTGVKSGETYKCGSGSSISSDILTYSGEFKVKSTDDVVVTADTTNTYYDFEIEVTDSVEMESTLFSWKNKLRDGETISFNDNGVILSLDAGHSFELGDYYTLQSEKKSSFTVSADDRKNVKYDAGDTISGTVYLIIDDTDLEVILKKEGYLLNVNKYYTLRLRKDDTVKFDGSQLIVTYSKETTSRYYDILEGGVPYTYSIDGVEGLLVKLHTRLSPEIEDIGDLKYAFILESLKNEQVLSVGVPDLLNELGKTLITYPFVLDNGDRLEIAKPTYVKAVAEQGGSLSYPVTFTVTEDEAEREAVSLCSNAVEKSGSGHIGKDTTITLQIRKQGETSTCSVEACLFNYNPEKDLGKTELTCKYDYPVVHIEGPFETLRFAENKWSCDRREVCGTAQAAFRYGVVTQFQLGEQLWQKVDGIADFDSLEVVPSGREFYYKLMADSFRVNDETKISHLGGKPALLHPGSLDIYAEQMVLKLPGTKQIILSGKLDKKIQAKNIDEDAVQKIEEALQIEDFSFTKVNRKVAEAGNFPYVYKVTLSSADDLQAIDCCNIPGQASATDGTVREGYSTYGCLRDRARGVRLSSYLPQTADLGQQCDKGEDTALEETPDEAAKAAEDAPIAPAAEKKSCTSLGYSNAGNKPGEDKYFYKCVEGEKAYMACDDSKNPPELGKFTTVVDRTHWVVKQCGLTVTKAMVQPELASVSYTKEGSECYDEGTYACLDDAKRARCTKTTLESEDETGAIVIETYLDWTESSACPRGTLCDSSVCSPLESITDPDECCAPLYGPEAAAVAPPTSTSDLYRCLCGKSGSTDGLCLSPLYADTGAVNGVYMTFKPGGISCPSGMSSPSAGVPTKYADDCTSTPQSGRRVLNDGTTVQCDFAAVYGDDSSFLASNIQNKNTATQALEGQCDKDEDVPYVGSADTYACVGNSLYRCGIDNGKVAAVGGAQVAAAVLGGHLIAGALPTAGTTGTALTTTGTTAVTTTTGTSTVAGTSTTALATVQGQAASAGAAAAGATAAGLSASEAAVAAAGGGEYVVAVAEAAQAFNGAVRTAHFVRQGDQLVMVLEWTGGTFTRFAGNAAQTYANYYNVAGRAAAAGVALAPALAPEDEESLLDGAYDMYERSSLWAGQYVGWSYALNFEWELEEVCTSGLERCDVRAGTCTLTQEGLDALERQSITRGFKY